MADITIHDWKEEDKTGTDFTFVKPVYHPKHWDVRRWWYKGPNVPYVSCARVDYSSSGNDYQIYIDGTTPLMNLKISNDGGDLSLTEERDIRRVLICLDLNAVTTGQSDEYVDIEYVPREGFIVRKNTLPDPVVDIPPVFTEDPEWVTTGIIVKGDTVTIRTGAYTGGMPKSDGTPPKLRGRWQVRGSGVTTNDSWRDTTELTEVSLDTSTGGWLPADFDEIRYQNQVRDYDPDTDDVRTTNKYVSWKDVIPEVNLAPIETTVDGVPYLQSQGAVFVVPDQELVFAVETSAESASIPKTYEWKKLTGTGDFITDTDQASVTFKAGTVGTQGAVVCEITSDYAEDSPQVGQIITVAVA